jgi:hypothetical protein
MTAQEARAIAMAHELHRLLGELFELPAHGAGSLVARAAYFRKHGKVEPTT